MYNKEDMICSFYVNDYHLAVMLVPYIYETVKEGRKVITFFDRDLDDIIDKIINTNKKFWENYDIFSNIDFKKLKFDKLAKKFENVKDNDLIIIVGSEDFIKRINSLIINFHTNFTILDCFNISDIAKDENFKITDYSKLLNTKGLEIIDNFDFV